MYDGENLRIIQWDVTYVLCVSVGFTNCIGNTV